MNKVIDKGFRSCRFVSTIVKHPVWAHGEKGFLRSLEKYGKIDSFSNFEVWKKSFGSVSVEKGNNFPDLIFSQEFW